MNYYEVLGISRNANFNTIKEAYFRMRKNASKEKLETLEKAYRVLTSKLAREEYDRRLDKDDKNKRREELYNALKPDLRGYDFVMTKEGDRYIYSYEKSSSDFIPVDLEEDVIKSNYEFSDIDDKLSITPTEISIALANLVKGDGNEYIEGTNVEKPRYRNAYENDEEYEEYLRGYYDEHFYIPGTKVLKPRDRMAYESDEHYNQYLEKYYKIIFSNQKEKEEKEEVLKVTKRKKSSKKKKALAALLVAGAIILGVLGIKSCSKSRSANNTNSTTTYSDNKEPLIDNDELTYDIAEATVEEESIITVEDADDSSYDTYYADDQKDEPSIRVGDKFNLDESTLLYYTSMDENATASIGSEYAPEGVYTIDKIVVLDANNKIVANSSFEDIDLDQYDSTYKKMFHFSKDVTAEDIETQRVESNNYKNTGWVFGNEFSLSQRVGNVVEESKTK